MARGQRRTAPILEDIIQKANVADLIISKKNSDLTYVTDGVTTMNTITEVSNKVDKLEIKVAEMASRDSRPGRRIKSIRIRF